MSNYDSTSATLARQHELLLNKKAARSLTHSGTLTDTLEELLLVKSNPDHKTCSNHDFVRNDDAAGLGIGGLTPGNTNPPKRREHRANPPGGVDTIADLKVHGEWDSETWKALRNKLSEVKQRAYEIDEWVPIELGGLMCEMRPTQAKSGKGMKATKYHWVLKVTNGLTVKIRDQEGFKKRTANIMVDFGSLGLMQAGPEFLWDWFKAWIGSIGFTITANHVARLDMCVDMTDVTMLQIGAHVTERRIACKPAKRGGHWNREIPETITWGRPGSPLHLRIYDKLAELEAKDDNAKLATLIEERWGGDLPDNAIRVEYEMHRDFFRESDIDSIEDFFEKQATLAAYLTHAWFRMLVAPVKNRHYKDVDTSPEWKKIQEAFRQSFGESTTKLVRKRKQWAQMPKRLMAQTKGCCESVLAMVGKVPKTREELFAFITESFTPFAGEMLMNISRKHDHMALEEVLHIETAPPGPYRMPDSFRAAFESS